MNGVRASRGWIRRLLPVAGLLPLLSGCASTGMDTSRVRLESPLDERCLESHLRGEKDVVGFRSMPEGGGTAWWFQLADPMLTGKEMPSILASQRERGDGPVVQLQATWKSSPGDAEVVREALLRREQDILARLLDECADSDVSFGSPAPCGKGEEKKTRCVQGNAHAR